MISSDSMEREPRDTQINVKFTAREARELERIAGRERMTVSSVVRAAALSYLALQLNRVAWRALGDSVKAMLRERFGSVVELPDVEEETTTRAK